MFRGVVGLVLVGVLAFIGSAQPVSASHPEDVTILVGDFWFCAPEFTAGVCVTDVQVGATVTWDFSPMGLNTLHTTTECGAACPPAGTPLWDSGLVGPGPGGPGDPTAHTFDTPGTYIYFCSVHPFTMNGQVNVGPVGGIAEIVDPAGVPLDTSGSSSGPSTAIVVLAAGAAVALGLSGAAWRARRRLR